MSHISLLQKLFTFSLDPFLPQKSRKPKLYKFVITKYRKKINTENYKYLKSYVIRET